MVSHVPPEALKEGGHAPPVFCFQTALQMLLWSWIAYTYTWVPHLRG